MSGFETGFREGFELDPERPDWSGAGPRPLRWSAWFPASEGALAEAPARLPVILLSHGTGGGASGLGWLARRLAAAGFVVLGVDHHGNTISEPYRAAGFLCWWERPRDLTVLLDRLSAEGPFAGRLDPGRIGAAGFSLGGYTALALAGAITRTELYFDWAAGTRFACGPREFPNAAAEMERLKKSDPPFRASWARQSRSYRDPRVKTVVALAPAPTVRGFTPESVAAIDLPVTILSGVADEEAPPAECGDWLGERLTDCALHSLGPAVGHYTLLPEGDEAMRKAAPALFTDAPGVDRGAVHEMAARIALAAFRGLLPA